MKRLEQKHVQKGGHILGFYTYSPNFSIKHIRKNKFGIILHMLQDNVIIFSFSIIETYFSSHRSLFHDLFLMAA